MITAGIDIGSNTAKAAILDDATILATHVILTGYNARNAGKRIFEEIIAKAGLTDSTIQRIVATGYGRSVVDKAAKAVTEITCHAAGVHFTYPDARFIIDIGGQDSKVILLSSEGNVKDFSMNDKCAAGTGRFLEVMARALEVDLDVFAELSLLSSEPSKISSLCTVFAESEVISLISRGEQRENIISGIHEAAASRVVSMAARIGIDSPVIMTGGVALNGGMVKALEEKLGIPITVSSFAQVNGAIGAAVLAQKI